jgi:hypothetical protein
LDQYETYRALNERPKQVQLYPTPLILPQMNHFRVRICAVAIARTEKANGDTACRSPYCLHSFHTTAWRKGGKRLATGTVSHLMLNCCRLAEIQHLRGCHHNHADDVSFVVSSFDLCALTQEVKGRLSFGFLPYQSYSCIVRL